MLERQVRIPRREGSEFMGILLAGIAGMGTFLAGMQAGRSVTVERMGEAIIQEQQRTIIEQKIELDGWSRWYGENYGFVSGYHGYNGGATQFRDLEIHDGGDMAAMFTGNTQIGNSLTDSHVINGNLTVNGTITVKPSGQTAIEIRHD